MQRVALGSFPVTIVNENIILILPLFFSILSKSVIQQQKLFIWFMNSFPDGEHN